MEQAGTEGRRSKYRGICWDKKHNGWRVTIFYAGKQRHVGRYADEVAAARAYDKAAVYLYGSHAITNFGLQACLEDPTEVKRCIVLTKMLAQAPPAQNSPAQGTQGTSQHVVGQSSSSSMQSQTHPIADSSIFQSHIQQPPGLYSSTQLDSFSFPDQQRAGSSSGNIPGRAVGLGLAGLQSHNFSPPGMSLMHLQQEQQQLQQQQGPYPMQLLQQQPQMPSDLAALVQQPPFAGTLQDLGPHYSLQPQQQLQSLSVQLQTPQLLHPQPLYVTQQQQLQLQQGPQQTLVQIPELSTIMSPRTSIPGLSFVAPAPSNVHILQAISQGQPGAHMSPIESLMPQWTMPGMQAAGFSMQNPEALMLQQPTIISSARPLHAAAQQQIQTTQQEIHRQLRFPWEH